MGGDDTIEVYAATRGEWRAWLERHAGRGQGVWLRYDKGPDRALTYDDIVEEALCFGWVDSRPRSVDAAQAMLYVAPRKPTSSWSRRNKERVERLVAAGLMRPEGLAAVEAAKRNGAWSAIDEVERLVEPPDLAAALNGRPDARRHWDAFPPSTRRAILEWIAAAKRPPTRAARIEQTAAEAAVNRRANQWRQPKGAPARPTARPDADRDPPS